MVHNKTYQFRRQTQIRVLAAMWRSPETWIQFSPYVKPRFFEDPIMVDLSRILGDYVESHEGALPSKETYLEEAYRCCKGTATKKVQFDMMEEIIEEMSGYNGDDLDFLTEIVVEFGRRRMFVEAVGQCLEGMYDGKTSDWGYISQTINDALATTFDQNDGVTDWASDAVERVVDYGIPEKDKPKDVIERVPTGDALLDECLNGGLGRTEMGVIVAPPGRGKTSVLVHLGAAAMEAGYKVLHVSLENNIKQILRNYDTRILGHSIEYIADNNEQCQKELQDKLDFFSQLNSEEAGTPLLKLKKYPTKSIGVGDIRNLLESLRLRDNWQPDVLIVDYGALLMPNGSKNQDKRFTLEQNYEELRALADKYNLALWTAAQGNRGSLTKKVVTMADLAECFAIGNISDVMIALCQTEKEHLNNVMRLYLPKIRDNADHFMLVGTLVYATRWLHMNEKVDALEEDATGQVTYNTKSKGSGEIDEDWDEAESSNPNKSLRDRARAQYKKSSIKSKPKP